MKRKRGEKREQSGIHHVAFRGNNRNVVFLDDLDRIKLLEFLGNALEKTGSTLMEICIMTNHCHIMVESQSITKLMKQFLPRYSLWHNKRYGESGSLFSSPFISYPKVTEENLLYNCAYILRNPIAAGMCDDVCDYKWSSVHVHFGCKDVVRARILKYVEIDTSLIDSKFKDKNEFVNYINAIPSGLREKYKSRRSAWNKLPFQELMRAAQGYIDAHFDGKRLGELSLRESDELAVHLYKNVGGTTSQIASMVKDSRYRVRKICGTTLQK
jgi:REP element-mobilizing transposase RayT